MDLRKPLDGRAIGLMSAACLAFAAQQIALKAAAPDMAPILQIGLRSGIAAVLVAVMMIRHGGFPAASLRAWRAGLVAGLLFTTEFVALGEGLRYTSTGHAVTFLYSAPIFAALGLQWTIRTERLSALQWAGVLLAFSGIGIAFLVPTLTAPADGDGLNTLIGDGLCLFAGLMWGCTTVVIRTTALSSLPAKPTLLYQLLTAAVVLPLVAWATGATSVVWTPILWASLGFQSLVVSFAIMLLWFWMLRHYLASRLGVLSFLTPLFGVALGVIILGESLDLAFVLGAILVALGITVVSGEGWIRQKLGRSVDLPVLGPKPNTCPD